MPCCFDHLCGNRLGGHAVFAGRLLAVHRGGHVWCGLMSLPLVMGLLLVAAILGDQTNYTIGRYFGPRVFQWEDSRFFSRKGFDQAHAFYEKYGGITIILARFMPFVRTFVPFVAGWPR
jgi:membrane-associated protein